MTTSAQIHKLLVSSGAGIFAGALLTWIVGDFNAAYYLVELMSIGPLEIPFIVLAAVIVHKFGWQMGIVFTVSGTVVSMSMFVPEVSIASIIYLKTALTGVIIGEVRWFGSSFTKRLFAASLPGFILAFVFGMPLIFKGVSPETLEEIKQEALEMYQAFMSQDNAKNAVENAMVMFKFFFQASLGIFFISSLVLSWLSFHVNRWILIKIKEEVEYIPPMYTFTVPFHAIWLFLAGLSLYIFEFKPLFPVTINVLFIMAGLYGIQGLAIVMYHMNRIAIGPVPRIFFWLVFFITITFTIILLIITGIVDSWINLRSVPLSSQNNGHEEENEHESNT
ncbi:MAG: DUF2232 domain-containing protein [Candidatus Latescibacteria bacterium]|nr:DUF2232 domain-containing protein [Candidatus Latescibacterota bacterium]